MASTSLSGVVVVDKPGGMTSHDVVDHLRKIYGTRRVGHAGTLDPIATGVLVVCIGQATRVLEYLAATRKRYTAGVLFGVTTDSQDITGTETARRPTPDLGRGDVEAVFPLFRGSIRQTPPMHSAVHHQGKRLYDLARQGIEVEREAREVEVYGLELLEFVPGEQAHAVLDVECSSGTYIRTLAADIGGAVGTGALMDSLRRTQVGPFGLDAAHSLDQLRECMDGSSLFQTVLPIRKALSHWRTILLPLNDVNLVRQGRRLPSDAAPGNVLLIDGSGQVVALAEADGQIIAPFKVFPAEE